MTTLAVSAACPRLALFLLLAMYFWTGLAAHELPSLLIGQKVEAFALPPIEGRALGFSSEDLRAGRVSLVNVFGSWCVACRTEHPFLIHGSAGRAADLRHRLAGEGSQGRPRLAGEMGDPYTLIGDSGAAIAFGVTGAPESFVLSMPAA